MRIKVTPEIAEKQTHGGIIEKRTGKSFVAVFDDDLKDFRHVGWYLEAASYFSGLVHCTEDFGKQIVAALEKELKKPVHWAGAPTEPERKVEDGLDEFDG